MTPPDSDEPKTKLRKIADKLTERGPMPNSVLTGKPDSDEREVRRHKTWCQSYYYDPVRGELYTCNCVEPPPSVSLPLALAQRILAALEGHPTLAPWRERDALAAELRERMPK